MRKAQRLSLWWGVRLYVNGFAFELKLLIFAYNLKR